MTKKNMLQIILKERAAHLGSYIFLQEMLINIKARHFYSSTTTKNSFFPEHSSLASFVLWILQSF